MATAVRGTRRSTARKGSPRKASPRTAAIAAVLGDAPEVVDVEEQHFGDNPYDVVLPPLPTTPPSEEYDPEPFLPYAGQEMEAFEPFEPEPETEAFPHYYHAYLPNLTIRKGRPEQIRFRGGITRPRNAQQEANVRAALRKYVPGGDVDRWKGDTPGFSRELRCPECGFFTSNLDVFDDHNRHTKHDVRIP